MVRSLDRVAVDLLGTVGLLHEHLTPALCRAVFDDVREGERERVWSLQLLAEFWVAVVLRAPRSLTQALEAASGGGGGGYPIVHASPQAFFSKCQNLTWEFFARIFTVFSASIEAAEPGRFAAHLRPVLRRFGGRIWAVDGTTLDPVARRLKLLHKDRRLPMPGSVVAFYDLARGTVAHLRFEPTPQGVEPVVAKAELAHVPPGTLLVADRLYGLPWFFEATQERQIYAVARRNERAGMLERETLSTTLEDGGTLTDRIVTVGLARTTQSQTLRCVTWSKGRMRLQLLTSVMEPARLSAAEMIRLYRERWCIERLFYDLKEVLDLHSFYAANTNAIAMQVYACAIVHVALRTAQGRIAAGAHVEPERISVEKLFPMVAAASITLTTLELGFEEVRRVNPGVTLRKPSWEKMKFAHTELHTLLVERRKPGGRKEGLRAPRRHRRRLPDPPPQPPR